MAIHLILRRWVSVFSKEVTIRHKIVIGSTPTSVVTRLVAVGGYVHSTAFNGIACIKIIVYNI